MGLFAQWKMSLRSDHSMLITLANNQHMHSQCRRWIFSADSLFLLSPTFHIDIQAVELQGKGFFCWGEGGRGTSQFRQDFFVLSVLLTSNAL